MKKYIRFTAFLLAMLMTASFCGCMTTAPSTTGPSDTQDLQALITQLESAKETVNTNYDESLNVLTIDFANKEDGQNAPQFLSTKAIMDQTKTNSLNDIDALMTVLQNADQQDDATVTAAVTKAQQLLTGHKHSYGEKISHSRNTEGTNCAETDHYAICTGCNAVQWSKGSHQWYYSRTEAGHHQICRNCAATTDTSEHTLAHGKCEECNYIVHANILVIEGVAGGANALCATIGDSHTVTVVDPTSSNFPANAETLQTYDQVILCNVDTQTLAEGFDQQLQRYVEEFGGSLFTVGNVTGTTYQNMMPVEMEKHPSTAVVILIDNSGSMWHEAGGQVYQESKFYAAKAAAEASLDELSVYDYIGVVGISEYTNKTELFPRTQRDKILEAIDSIPNQGATIFSCALSSAADALNSLQNVDNKHIILITDGEPSEEDFENYTQEMRKIRDAGITISFIGLQMTSVAKLRMQEVLTKYAGMTADHFYDVLDISQTTNVIRQDLQVVTGATTDYPTFQPSITTQTSITEGILPEDMPVLGYAFPCTLKDGATEVLGSPYGPLYAQWQFGNGTVGSFLYDQSLSQESYVTILQNIILCLINQDTAEN